MTFGEKILALRKQKGWSQQEVAKMLGTSGPIVGRYERDEMTPSVEVAKKLSRIFGVTLDYLVDETGEVEEFKDKTMLKRWVEIERLEPKEKERIVNVVDSLVRDAKARKAYEMHNQ